MSNNVYTFDKQFIKGQAGEKFFFDWMEQRKPGHIKRNNTNNCYDPDFITAEKKPKGIELKSDFQAYLNLFIEIEVEKPDLTYAGSVFKKDHYWFVYLHTYLGIIFIFQREILKDWVEKNIWTENNQKGYKIKTVYNNDSRGKYVARGIAVPWDKLLSLCQYASSVDTSSIKHLISYPKYKKAA